MSTHTLSFASRAARYDADDIALLSGVEAIRRRPALYVGSVGPEGMQHLVFEVIENAVDEFLAGACDAVLVRLHEDGSCTVKDNGRGIPLGVHAESSRPVAELLFTELHSGGKFDGDAYRFSGGLHGLGLTCVNALSEWLSVDIVHDGRRYVQEFTRGKPRAPVEQPAGASRTGTTIHFRPDTGIFGCDATFSFDTLVDRLQELAYLNAGLTLAIESPDRRQNFRSDAGLKGLLAELNRGTRAVHDGAIVCHGADADVIVEIALQWTYRHAECIRSFVNSVRTSARGPHVEGLAMAAAQTLRKLALTLGLSAPDEEITLPDVLSGLSAVVSVRMHAAQFDSQTKSHLVARGLEPRIEGLLAAALGSQLRPASPGARAIVEHVLKSRHARVSSERSLLGTRYAPLEAPQSLDVYRKQFGIRSKEWHESCAWLTDEGLLGAHAAACKVGPDATMLDVCCGSGIVGASFGTGFKRKIGLDITPEMLALARTRLDEVREGSIYDMPFADASFEIVVTREVFHLLPRLHRPLSEIFRVLRPGGQLVFGQTVPFGAKDAPWMFRIFKKKQPLFCNNYLAEDFMEMLAAQGFGEIEFKEYLQWEPIDRWIDTHETSAYNRSEIRDLYYNAPDDVKEIHPFEINADGMIRDCWRWCVFSARKPG
jgi:DNA gyrase subunit B